MQLYTVAGNYQGCTTQQKFTMIMDSQRSASYQTKTPLINFIQLSQITNDLLSWKLDPVQTLVLVQSLASVCCSHPLFTPAVGEGLVCFGRHSVLSNQCPPVCRPQPVFTRSDATSTASPLPYKRVDRHLAQNLDGAPSTVDEYNKSFFIATVGKG